jgi:hypothetical protein
MVARKLLILLRVILAGTTAGVCDASGLAVRISNAKSTAYAAKRAILPVLWRTPGAKRARVAVARKLAVIMHRMWVSGSEFETGVEKPKMAAA